MAEIIHRELFNENGEVIGYEYGGRLVRCGKCKYKDDGVDENGRPFLKCLHGRSYGGTRVNDYCSWGRHREDDDGDD